MFKKPPIPLFLISQKPAIHQFAGVSYFDQHGVCLNTVVLDKVMEWRLHTNTIRRSPHLIKTNDDITQTFRSLIAAVGKSLSLSVCLSGSLSPPGLAAFLLLRLPSSVMLTPLAVHGCATVWVCVCAGLRLGWAYSSTGVQCCGGCGRACHWTGVLLPRQQTVFVYMDVCVCVSVWPSNTDKKGLHSSYMCSHIHSCTHRHCASVVAVGGVF